jgi:hypothetical protein
MLRCRIVSPLELVLELFLRVSNTQDSSVITKFFVVSELEINRLVYVKVVSRIEICFHVI